MAGAKEPGGSGPNVTGGSDGKERPDAEGQLRPTSGRIPSLTPLKAVAAAAGEKAPPPEAKPFRPNVTAYWTPPVPTSGQEQSGFIRIATPISTRPDGVVSIISPRAAPLADRPGAPGRSPAAPSSEILDSRAEDARAGIVSISAGSPVMYPETPPFGISKLAGIITEQNAQGVPSRVGVARSGRIPFRVGDYEVATRLAQGGTGSIYICRRARSTPTLYALKVIRQHALQKEAVIASFKREARVGKLLRHPNALTVVDEGTYENQPFLILPYVEGGTVSALLADGMHGPPENIVTVLLDILRTLQAVHDLKNEQGQSLGMVHGDISPDNILVGADGIARLTDFGSARLAESGPGEADAFGLGKPSYMSPEQLRGEPLDARSDIFAVGIVMWTALTGQKLFAADTYDQTVMRVMRRKIPAPSSLGGPPQLDDVCLTALNRSRESRFSSANEMADALMTAAVKADLVATRERVAHWVRRDMGETLTELRRRVDNMFGDNVKTPPPLLPGEAARPRPATTPITGVPPAATIQMNALLRGGAGAFGATKIDGPARTLFIPGGVQAADSPAAGSKLSRKQWYIIVSLSLATFFLTLMIGTWVSRPSGFRPGLTSLPSGAGAVPTTKSNQ